MGIFIACLVAGVIAFATFKGSGKVVDIPEISIWGTFPKDLFDQYLYKMNESLSQPLKVTYSQIPEASFDNTFIQALARGQGPDAVLIPQDLLHRHEDKIVVIPYTTLPQRDFQNTFIQQAELYLASNGTLAIPFVVDPLVMYWNRDIFTNAGIAYPPKYWDEFTNLNTKITQKDTNSNIKKSAIALGEFNNIIHAREIFGTLLLQYGNPVTYRDNSGAVVSALGSGSFSGLSSSVPALNFFTQFSNPSSKDYSWNRSLTNSKNSFLSGSLATYFGFASEVRDIRLKNPNLDFDVTYMPQRFNSGNRVTFGSMYGFSIIRSSVNNAAAFSIISTLIAKSSLEKMVTLTYLPPVRRDMISLGSIDPYLSVFYESALISGAWLDSNKIESNNIFQRMIESVTSGRSDKESALQSGSGEFDILLTQ